MKKINGILIIAALAMLFCYSPSRAQENNGTLLDSLSEEDDLLDSNLVYKEMYEDTLKDQGNWVKIVKSDFIKDVNGTDTELDDLSTSGTDDYMYVWRPNAMEYNPYVNGRWVFTYDGWVWVSNNYWGWTCYHYGRWWWSPFYGWVWIPGRVWASNWCYWREYGDYYGWYPYGPRIHWRTHHGNHHNRVIITHPTKWVFVNKKKLNENITKKDVLKTNLKDVVKNSTRINNINTYDGNVKYTGPDVTAVSVNTGKKITPETISTVKTRNEQEIKTKNNTVSTKDDNNYGKKNNTNYEGNKNKSTESGNNNNTYNSKKETNKNNESTRSGNNENRESTRSGNSENNGNRESTRSGNNGNRESTRSGNSGNNGNRESTRSGNSGNNGSRSTSPKKISENTNQNSVNSSSNNNYVQKQTYTAPKTETKTYTPPKQETKTYTPPKQETKTYTPP
ncbi:MAG: hypothetical protein LWX07_01355, partial [Bacteroidetes bacterium]|nr:hypothetical protein [Bacteroidota bacterium]